ncbi:hypothetical protein RHGRI_012164 [Rhododendron griersonianum]|uniref:Uncharacterized protein n=1 Tax=Rhododendron griersonianum TaxID=479676 RepID=A0AAV6KQ06_9ERIC|nr:hypothetical protein RHGRI_012164 [Rhododendron griersonianum]
MKLEMSSFSWCAIKSNGVANWVAQAMREKNLSKNGAQRERESPVVASMFIPDLESQPSLQEQVLPFQELFGD